MRSGRNDKLAHLFRAKSISDWDMRSGRNQTGRTPKHPHEYKRLGYALWPELERHVTDRGSQYKRLGYALWPELQMAADHAGAKYKRLGYALWPELGLFAPFVARKYKRLGYALWPEPSNRCAMPRT